MANDCTKNDNFAILITMAITGLVSLIPCVSIIVLLFCLKLNRSFIYRMAMYQVIASMVMSIIDIFSLSGIIWICKDKNHTQSDSYNGMCITLAILRTYTEWVKLLFTFFLILHLSLMIVYLNEYKKREKLNVSISLAAPIVISLIPAIPFKSFNYGRAGAWCWIKGDDTVGTVEQFVLWYIPCLIFLGVCIGFIINIIALSIKREDIQSENKLRKALRGISPLLVYTGIFFLFNLIGTFDRLTGSRYNELVGIHGATNGLWGFFTSLAVFIHVCLTKWKELKIFFCGSTVLDNVDGNDAEAVNHVTSRASTTHYDIPRESEADRLIERSNRNE